LAVGFFLLFVIPSLPSNPFISVVFVLQKNTTLKELSLCGNKIGGEGGKAIGKALEVSHVLVSSFSFSCAVTASLVTNLVCVILVLQENRTLLELSLGSNKIGDEGTKALAKAIEVGPLFFVIVRRVWLPSLSLTRLDFCSLPKQKNQTLQRVDLAYNKIGDVGAAALAKEIAVSCVARGCWFLCIGYCPPPSPPLPLPSAPPRQPTSFL
jgi:hypothetical protein